MDPIRFVSRVRFWDPQKLAGLAVADIPAGHVEAFGGLKQQRVSGTVGGAPFTSNVMPAGGGRLALSVSKAMMRSLGLAVGDEAEFTITSIGRD